MQFGTSQEVEKYAKYMKSIERAATILLRLTKKVEENATEKQMQQALNHKKLARQIQAAERDQNNLDQKHEEISDMILKYFGNEGLDKFNGFLKEKLRLSLLEWELRNDIRSIDICLTASCNV